MIATKRMILYPLNYEELCEYVHSGKMITKDEPNAIYNVNNYTILPMLKAPISDHLFYTFWLGDFCGETVVETGFLRPPNAEGIVEIWCAVNEKFRNMGFGSEAIVSLTKWAESKPNVKFVAASVKPNNLASKRMLEKCGYDYATDSKDMNIYFANLDKV